MTQFKAMRFKDRDIAILLNSLCVKIYKTVSSRCPYNDNVFMLLGPGVMGWKILNLSNYYLKNFFTDTPIPIMASSADYMQVIRNSLKHKRKKTALQREKIKKNMAAILPLIDMHRLQSIVSEETTCSLDDLSIACRVKLNTYRVKHKRALSVDRL